MPGDPVGAGTDGLAFQEEQPRRRVADRRAVMDAPPPLPGLVPGAYREHTDLHLEVGGHAVARLQLVIQLGLAVGVQIDEPRRHHQAGDIDDLAPLERLR